jgi:hypothetical protein
MIKLGEANEYKFSAILGRISGTVNPDVAANGTDSRQSNCSRRKGDAGFQG